MLLPIIIQANNSIVVSNIAWFGKAAYNNTLPKTNEMQARMFSAVRLLIYIIFLTVKRKPFSTFRRMFVFPSAEGQRFCVIVVMQYYKIIAVL